MKKMIAVIFMVMCMVVILLNSASATEVNLRYDPSISPLENIFSESGFAAGYTLLGLAYGDLNNEQSNLAQRSIFLLSDVTFSYVSKHIMHERGHIVSAKKNGVNERYDFSQDIVVFNWPIDTPPKYKVKMTAAGLHENNLAAENAFSVDLGNKTDSRMMLFGIVNQLEFPIYVSISKNRDSHTTKDPECWAQDVSGGEPTLQKKYFNGLTYGAVWQGLGVIYPSLIIAQHWWTGEKVQLPNWWLNPQVELTEVGMLYSLDIYRKMDSGMLIRVRPAMGRDHMSNRNIYAIESEISKIDTGVNIPFLMESRKNILVGLKGGLNWNISESDGPWFQKVRQQKMNYFAGSSFDVPVTKIVSLGLEYAYYSGYHRSNPVPGSYQDLFVRTGFNF